jgi:hypothetical protein
MRVEFDQVCALVIIVGGMVLRCIGIDTEIWALVLLAAGFLFGTGYQARKKAKGA